MKEVTIGKASFSKILCGSNPFWGHSHFSEARDQEYLGRFDDDAIRRALRRCLSLGVNTVESCLNHRIATLLGELRAAHPGGVRFVGTTRVDETSPIKSHTEKLAQLIALRAEICVIHAQFVDRPGGGARLESLKPMVDQIHAAGLLAGISTHRIQTVEQCEAQGCGLDTYLFPLNLSGFVYPGYAGKETAAERAHLVRHVPKPFILIKTLGAGRIPPSEGLAFIGANAKPNDLVSLGLGSEDEIAETLKIAEHCL